MEPRELVLRMAGCVEDMAQTSDTEESTQLVKRAMAGDRVAFDQIILRHQRRVLMTAWRLLGSKEDAQDAAGGTYVLAFLPGCRRSGALPSLASFPRKRESSSFT